MAIPTGKLNRIRGVLTQFGFNPDSSGVLMPRMIWPFDIQYVQPSDLGEDMFFSSSDNSDNQQIKLKGLDENFELQTVIQNVNGQAKTLIEGPSASAVKWSRVFEIENIGSTPLQGICCCYANDSVTLGIPDNQESIKALISIGDGMSHACFATCPSGTTVGAIVSGVSIGVAKSSGNPTGAMFQLVKREFGKTPVVIRKILAPEGSSTNQESVVFNIENVTPRTDVSIEIVSVKTPNVVLTAGFEMLLIHQ